MKDYSECIGYLKYEGSSVADGYLDARKAADALMGFDESIRYYLLKYGVTDDFEIPVRIRKGSWEALIPNTLLQWVVTATGAGATMYVVTAAAQVAKNDFQNISLGELIQRALCRIQKSIKISKHLEGKHASDVSGTIINNYTIVLPGRNGSKLEVTKEELEDYASFPPIILSKMASVITDDRVLKLGLVKKDHVIEEEIGVADRKLFYKEKDTEVELLPELKDGAIVDIEGMLTRGNTRTNSLGLEYRGYVLTCKPEQGSVEVYKSFLFTKCVVRGLVDRTTSRKEKEKKPHLIIIEITEKDKDFGQPRMFNTKNP